MPRYNRLRTSGDQQFSDRDSYLFQASEDVVSVVAQQGPAPSGMTVSSGPPSSSADEGNGDPCLVQDGGKQQTPPGKLKGGGASATTPPRSEQKQSRDVAQEFDKGQAAARETAPRKAAAAAENGGSSGSHSGVSRFGATLYRVTSFRDTGKQSKYSRIPEQGGNWGRDHGNGREYGGRDQWEQTEAPGSASNSTHRVSSLRDGGSWAAAVQRTASIRDAGGHYGSLDHLGLESGSQFERHIKGSSHPVLDPIAIDRHIGRTDSFDRSSTVDRTNGTGSGRGGGGGYGDAYDSDVFVPSRERDEIPSSLGAAVQRALSLREGHLATTATRAAHHHHPRESQHHSQRFHRARDHLSEHITPVYSSSADPEEWEQQAELRFWAGGSVQKVHSQSMRYDRVTIPLHDIDAEDDYGHRSSSVGEKDRNACVTAPALLKRAGSVREQVSKSGMSSARVYSMREHSHFLQCATCGRGLGAVNKGVPGPETVQICQACSRPRQASHWTDPAYGKDAIPAWAVPPRKKKGLFHSWRRMLGLKGATGGAT